MLVWWSQITQWVRLGSGYAQQGGSHGVFKCSVPEPAREMPPYTQILIPLNWPRSKSTSRLHDLKRPMRLVGAATTVYKQVAPILSRPAASLVDPQVFAPNISRGLSTSHSSISPPQRHQAPPVYLIPWISELDASCMSDDFCTWPSLGDATVPTNPNIFASASARIEI